MNPQPDAPTPPKAKPTALRTAALIGLGLVGAAVMALYLSPNALKYATKAWDAPAVTIAWIANGAIWAAVAALIRHSGRHNRRGRETEAAGNTTGRRRTRDALSLLLLFITASGVMILLLLAASVPYASDLGFFYSLYFRPVYAMRDDWLSVLTVLTMLDLSLAITALAWRSGARSTLWGVAGLMILTPVFVYLAKDDAEVRYPFKLTEISPVKPGMAESYAVLMQWASGSENVRRLE
ncbi:MAG: hypothetical protein RIQ79_2295, partial [Verrucomicrobiota bacterium]